MFDGVPAEQLHQLLAAASRTSLPLPLPLSSFPSAALHAPSAPPGFDDPNYNNNPSQHHHHLHQNHQLLLQPHHHHPHQLLNNPAGGGGLQLHHRQSPAPAATHKNHEAEKEENNASTLVSAMNNDLEIERERSSSISSQVPIINDHPWGNDELLALLRIRSTMENWFPEFTWEHVSRKLAEVGFKRSAEKCKEKFEEESTYFNNINFSKNFRYLSGLEDLYQGAPGGQDDRAAAAAENNKSQQKEVLEKPSEEGDHQDKSCTQILDENSARNKKVVAAVGSQDNEKEVVEGTKSNNNSKKRKRQKKFEMLKGFCEDIVKKMMAQQEAMHNKLLEEMVKRNEEKLAREDAWKKQEVERMNKELEIMAHEQAVAGDRQATIINFLKKFTSSSGPSPDDVQAQNPNQPKISGVRFLHSSTISEQKESDHHQEPSSSTVIQNNPTTPTSLTETLGPQSPSSSTLITTAPTPTSNIPKVPMISSTSTPIAVPQENPSSQNPTSIDISDKQDLGKRWPRDEVLALINLRCSLFNNGSAADQDKEGVAKAPLWERISKGMLEMGYKRSAKRCKEKWENINKYFRKTKDVNKKRSLDSRTCPYFHQLSTLYDQGVLVPPSDHHIHQGPPDHQPENRSASPENRSLVASRGDDSTMNDNVVAHEGEKNNMVQQVPAAAFDFEF